MIKSSPNQGFVILYAVLLVSIVLTISLSLMNITYRQIILSQVARESIVAFAAADAGLDCARYWDLSRNVIANQEPSPDNRPFGYYDDQLVFHDGSEPFTIICSNSFVGGEVPIERTAGGAIHTSKFKVDYRDDQGLSLARKTCALVTVTKTDYGPGSGGYTTIDSFGYNTDCATASAVNNGGTPSPRVVERSLTTTY
jgi:hypothetical protein